MHARTGEIQRALQSGESKTNSYCNRHEYVPTSDRPGIRFHVQRNIYFRPWNGESLHYDGHQLVLLSLGYGRRIVPERSRWSEVSLSLHYSMHYYLPR